ncbi:MAG TPA: type II toxin-antitoxin system ParD family antitoxin, partial [Stellaceae bacterium]|nr:type II toxin-antitoxin system ParD family antitoxin [Stellaceae bacterium]
SVELPARMADTVRAAVASGDYADAGEVVRDALRDWSAKRRVATAELEELRQLIREGDESGPGIDAELVFARLRAKYAAMAEG